MLHMQSGAWKSDKISNELIRASGFNYGLTTHAVRASVFCVGFPLDMGDLERRVLKDQAPHLQTGSPGLMRSALLHCQLIKGWMPLKLHKSGFNVTGDREVVRAQPYDLSGWVQQRTCLDNDARMYAIDHNSLLCLYGWKHWRKMEARFPGSTLCWEEVMRGNTTEEGLNNVTNVFTLRFPSHLWSFF